MMGKCSHCEEDAITLFTVIIGGFRAGFTVFPISPRNSPEALASLLTRTKARILLTTREPGITTVVLSAEKVFPAEDTFPVKCDMIKFEELYVHDGEAVPHAVPCKPWALDDPQLIMHSSGEYYRHPIFSLR